RMPEPNVGRDSEQKRSDPLEQFHAKEGFESLQDLDRYTKCQPLLSQPKTPTDGIMLCGQGASPIGVVTMRLGSPLSLRTNICNETIRVGNHTIERRRMLASMEDNGMKGILPVERRCPLRQALRQRARIVPASAKK